MISTMKKQSKTIAKALMLSLLSLYLSSGAQATPCHAFLCLNNVPGMVPAECKAYRQQYFLIQIWSPAFNPPATAEARNNYLVAGCPTADTSLLAAVKTKYGLMMVDPGT